MAGGRVEAKAHSGIRFRRASPTGVSPRSLRTFSRVLTGSLNISQTRRIFVPKPSSAADRSLAMRLSSFTESRASLAHWMASRGTFSFLL